MGRTTSLYRTLLTIALFIALEAVSLVLLTNNGAVQRYRILGAVRGAQIHMWKNGESIRHYFSLASTNGYLAEENAFLRREMEYYKALTHELDSTRGIDIRDSRYGYINAEVVKNSVNKQHNYIIIDKGAADGLKNDMGVITGNGVVGVIHSVSEHHSLVISLLNTSQSVSVKIAGNGVFGPMTWTGTNTSTAIVKSIPLRTEVSVGDTIATSGYSIMFPPDIPVGVVERLDDSSGTTLDLYVRLFTNYNSLHYVYVVTDRSADELKELDARSDDGKKSRKGK